MTCAQTQLELLKQNVEQLIDEATLLERLQSKRPLKVKFGVDPTRPDLTFGHLVVFNKLKTFQEFGHEAILLIGDYTTLIGDPSGRSSTRPVLTRKEIQENTKTYLDQAFKILDPKKTIVRYNSEWFDKKGLEDCLILARKMTVARMLERDDFSKRYKAGNPISIVEFLYPLLQGQDSVELHADVELGGTDQLFNLLVGRALQKEAGQKEQIVMTSPLLIGLDGSQKMSKSLGNYIAFNDSSKDMFGKILSIPDSLMPDYYRLLLMKNEGFLKELETLHPMEAKKQLAESLVTCFFDKDTAKAERRSFENVFSKKQTPTDMPVFSWAHLCPSKLEINIIELLILTGLFPSKNELKRLIEQGGLRLGDEKISNSQLNLPAPQDKPYIIQAGKRTFLKIQS